MPLIVDIATEGTTGNGAGIPVSDLLRRFRTIMLDAKSVRWSVMEAIDWMNDGASEIVLRRPGARAVTEQIQLLGGTFQRASNGAAQVLDIVRNIGVDGKPGRSIRIADRQQIDDHEPNWHRMRAATTRHYMIDERSPTTFYVYPPAVEGSTVEMIVSKPPPKVTAEGDTIDMRPEFINAILNWMMYRAHSKDSEYSQGAVASLHYQAFTDAIGAPSQAAQLNSATGNSK
jgi:hypothetical protein